MPADRNAPASDLCRLSAPGHATKPSVGRRCSRDGNGRAQAEACMEHRQFGRSGLKVPVLGFGTATFGGVGPFFERWGRTDAAEAERLVDLCLEAGANFFDTAD